MLIGADFYLSLVSGVLNKDDHSRLVAVSAKMGWLLSGHVVSSAVVSGGDRNDTVHTQVMKLSNELSDMEELNEDLNRFWDLDPCLNWNNGK